MTSSPLIFATRRLLCACLYYSGLNWAFRFLLKKRQCLVLMYHKVVDPAVLDGFDAEFLNPGLYVTTQDFEMQMAYLATHYEVIDVARLTRALNGEEKLPPHACVITFDDGWRDTYSCALPILRRYNFPATVFLVSDYVGTNRWFWWDKVSLLLSRYLASGAPVEALEAACPTVKATGLGPVLARSRPPAAPSIARVVEAMKTLAPSDIDRVVHEFEGALLARGVKFTYSERLILNWEEVLELGKARITVGAHTKTHAILTKISTRDAAEEIQQSKTVIERRLGVACSSFCYPNGEYDEGVKDQVTAQFECAFTAWQGLVRLRDDPFALSRIGIRHATSNTRAQFACQASGLVPLLVGAIRNLCAFL